MYSKALQLFFKHGLDIHSIKVVFLPKIGPLEKKFFYDFRT